MFTYHLKKEESKASPLFILASGPSLRDCNVKKLKNCYTMAFNRSYIAFNDWGFEPTYFAGLDLVVNQDNKDEFRNLIFHSSIKRFFFPDNDFSRKNFHSRKTTLIRTNGRNPLHPDLDFEKELTVANSGLFGLQIAIGLLGFKEIYLLGCDANYKEHVPGVNIINGLYKSGENKDINHFREDYYGKGTTYNKPCSDLWHYKAWKAFFREQIKQRQNEIKIYNCSPISRLTFFEYKDFKEIEKSIKKYQL
ncbi:DUF115 domain-containing protein [Patescibacteria group bacterium]|nr:DUF115 domain-containing protein [Patescibacteria group bacterium]